MAERIEGVDMSVFQSGIDYKALAADGVKFAVIRAGISRSKDTALDEHVKGCLEAGIDVGYYWYSYAKTVDEARREARECVKVISKYPAPKYPVFFDGEVDSIAISVGKKNMTDIALAFIGEIEESGYPSGIYPNPAWLENRYEKARLIGKVDIWLANWTWNAATPSKYNYGQTMWQWGLIKAKSAAGAEMDVDADLCFVDYPARTAEFYEKYNNSKKSVEELAIEVLHGLWGNGVDRKSRLLNAGYDYNAVQEEVNRLLEEEKKAQKSTEVLAVEVVRGLWGNGADRKQRLEAAGYDYDEVQAEVDRLTKN